LNADPAENATPDVSPLSLPAPEALALVRQVMPELLKKSQVLVEGGRLPLIGWGATLPRVLVMEHWIDSDFRTQRPGWSQHQDKPWFVIGDIHGDFLAWHTLLAHLTKTPDFRLCFLGDLVDRGPLSLECFALLMDCAIRHPHQILWLLGNHDQGIRYLPARKRFSSSVEPAEFLDQLNPPGDTPAEGDADRDGRKAWGNLFIQVAERLPRAALFPNGLLATHGGIPLNDKWPSLDCLEAFHDNRCLQDFTWNRVADARFRFINKKLRGEQTTWEFGYEDLEKFCDKVRAFFPVKAVVRGHDHVKGRVQKLDSFQKVPLVTLNGFGFDYLTNSILKEHYAADLVYGRMVAEGLPLVETVPADMPAHAGVYPPKAEGN
jgi:hypothetical protein